MYLVVGANGFLGSYIIKNIKENTDDKIIATARNIDFENLDKKRIFWVSCDVTDYKQVDNLCKYITKKTSEKIKIIYLAAYHNPDLVEKNPRIAWNINITALSYFINRIENIKCFFYPSSDSVYGESRNGYHFKESDCLNPVNIYGHQKVIAEQIVTGYGYNIVRFPFLISPSIAPQKKHFYDIIVEKLRMGQEIEMFSDSYRSTISFNQAAKILITLMESYNQKLPKKINICADKDLSKYDVGLLIAKKINADEKLIKPASVASTNGIFDAKRASSTLMDNAIIKSILGVKNIKLEL